MLATDKTAAEVVADLPVPPLLGREHALFLDVDGCLIELAPSPGEVQVPVQLPQLLEDLGHALDGAVAVITGRSLATVDEMLAPWRAAGAGVHGAEMRLPRDRETRRPDGSLRQVVERLRERFRARPEVLVEDKGLAVAVHYARCPDMREHCEAALVEETRHLPGLRLQRGRAVLEALPADSDKGSALMSLMGFEPFSGRVPVFAGDDRTDEAAFEVLRRQQRGIGIKVGGGATAARYRLGAPSEVRLWLEASLGVLRGER